MKTKETEMNTENTMTGQAIYQNVPMFMPTKMEQPMANTNKTQSEPMTAELSVFDVKELYDLAYAEKGTNEAKFKELLAEAVNLDLIYRRQLALKAAYKDKTQLKTFKSATAQTSRVA